MALPLRPARPPHRQAAARPDGTHAVEQVDFVWDGSTLAEQVHNGSAATTWDWAPGGRQPVSQTHRDREQTWVDGQFYSIVTDLVGTASELVDEQGNLAWRRQSSLWGEALSRRTDRASTPLRFPGQYFDAETELHYNYHRYYDPAAGQYVSHDPLGLAPSPNTQGYVVNPTGWIDPFGLEGCTFENQQPGHAAIADGSRVRAAGQANVAGSSDAGYFGLEIDSHSGHYFHGVAHDGDAVIQEGRPLRCARHVGEEPGRWRLTSSMR